MRCLCALLQHVTAARALRLSSLGVRPCGRMRMFARCAGPDLLRYVCMSERRTLGNVYRDVRLQPKETNVERLVVYGLPFVAPRCDN